MGTDVSGRQIDLLLLAVLESGPAHGYAVIAALRARSDGVLDFAEGTIYPALHRLEAARQVASTRESVAGRQRRVYAITRSGRAALAQMRDDWERTVRSVGAVLAVAQ